MVKKSTQIWKLIYGLTTVKQGEADPLEGKIDDNDDYDKKDDNKKHDGKEENTIREETKKKEDDTKITEPEQQNE